MRRRAISEFVCFFFQAEDGIRDGRVTGVQTCALPIWNKMHIHSSDQVLFVTAGKGIIATETYQETITIGDVVHIPAEEKHWHGATPDSSFSHIALTAKGSTTTQVEE